MNNFLRKIRLELSSFLFFILIMAIFIIVSPNVFLKLQIYMAVFTTLGLVVILTMAMVFVVVGGEIDLSFPSIIGLSAYFFSLLISKNVNPFIAMIAGLAVGAIIGLFNGLLITKVGLPSLVLTLGMNFLLRGLILILTEGFKIPLLTLRGTFFRNLFVGEIGEIGFPAQMLWAMVFLFIFFILFYRHKFGGYVMYTGDNMMSSREMGINVDRVKTITFVIVGVSSAFVGISSSLLNNVFYPTSGDGYLLMILAAVFLGGTPTWGGIGTIFGAVIGAFIISFIQTGIIAVGLTGYYTQFFFGLIVTIAIVSHKFAQGNNTRWLKSK